MQSTASTDKFLTFKLQKENYAINVMQVVEIIRLQKITPVPHMPSYIKGVINLRGKVIPVLDLRERLGYKDPKSDDHTCIVVVQAHLSDKTTMSCGLTVDEVDEVITIAEESVQPTPDIGGKSSAKFFSGVITAREQVTTLLDLNKLLNEELSLKK